MSHQPKYSQDYRYGHPPSTAPRQKTRTVLRLRRLLVLIFSVLGVTLVLLFISDLLNYLLHYRAIISTSETEEALELAVVESEHVLRPPVPRISVIVIWENNNPGAAGGYRPYFPNFIESFRANAKTVELLWIGVRQADHESCYDPTLSTSALKTSNIKVICLDRIQYWTMHRDYFCARWQCNKEENEDVLQTMLERHHRDWYKSFFRLWRGYVFRQFMDPSVEWWGWADHDTFMGNFHSQFPWDAATRFDIIAPTTGGDRLLYVRGHLCFFRVGAETETKLNGYENLTSPEAYRNNHVPTDWAKEEAEFSSFIFGNTDISFLIVPQSLVDIPHSLVSPKTPRFATLHGTYRVQDIWNTQHLPSFPNYPVLALPRSPTSSSSSDPSSFLPTFSSSGSTHPVEIFQGRWEGDLWFPNAYATYYYPTAGTADMHNWRRFLGRGGGFAGGPQGVWERFEPPLPGIEVSAVHDASVKVMLEEGLYIHWFEEKYNGPWFSALPTRPLLPGQTLVTALKYGAVIWDDETGDVVWRGEAANE